MSEGGNIEYQPIHPKAVMRGHMLENQLDLDGASTASIQVGGEQSFIRWPTEREIEGVYISMARIVKRGVCVEANGDYFKSGDLSYQILQIIRATDQLCRKSQRAKS